MFDYHMHSLVSFDGHCSGRAMAQAAKEAGMQEICFTDHIDYQLGDDPLAMVFDTERYNAEYEGLEIPGLQIRHGLEFGMKPYNQEQFARDVQRRPFDFVLGSVHFVDEVDVYFPPYWEGKTVFEAEQKFLEQTLRCVQAHDRFDVLAHLTFLSKAPCHPTKTCVRYADHREIIDAILEQLVKKGKGLEMNTSGIDRCGGFLPTEDVFRRFHELGGQIVTVGSDAHTTDRVGQYTFEACRILGEIFGYVCTFQNRQPIFHKL